MKRKKVRFTSSKVNPVGEESCSASLNGTPNDSQLENSSQVMGADGHTKDKSTVPAMKESSAEHQVFEYGKYAGNNA